MDGRIGGEVVSSGHRGGGYLEHPDRGVGRVWDLDTPGQEVGGVHEIIEFSWTSFIYDPEDSHNP